MNIYALSQMKALLEANGFFFKKNLGQNFLMNESIAFKIASSSRETIPENVPCLALEIGPGAGSLTLQLSRMFDRVLALEIDPHLLPVLSATLEETDNVEVEQWDALEFPYNELKDKYPGFAIAVCSNLPYYITSEIIMKLLESGADVVSITVLIQQEAADRLCAAAGSPQYGSISAAVKFYATTEKLFLVGPGNFYPKPKVQSAVLRLIPRKEPLVNPKSRKLFFLLLRSAFSARRKTILNALSISFGKVISKEQLAAALDRCDIDPTCRGETLNLDDYCKLSDALSDWEDVI